METAGIEPAPPRCKRGAPPPELRPRARPRRASVAARCGRVESNHQSSRRPGYSRVSSPGAQRPRGGVTGRARTGAAGITAPDASHYTTVTTGGHFSRRNCRLRAVTRDGDDRTRTGGLSPDKRALCSSELRPLQGCKRKKRFHRFFLDVSTFAASTPSRRVWLAGVEPAVSGSRSRRGGQLPYSQVSNECPRCAGAGHELQRQGSNLRLAVNSRASYRLDYAGTMRMAPAGVEPAPSRVRAGSSADLSYGASMWPAGIEPAAPRVSDGRSTR